MAVITAPAVMTATTATMAIAIPTRTILCLQGPREAPTENTETPETPETLEILVIPVIHAPLGAEIYSAHLRATSPFVLTNHQASAIRIARQSQLALVALLEAPPGVHTRIAALARGTPGVVVVDHDACGSPSGPPNVPFCKALATPSPLRTLLMRKTV